MKLTKQKLKQIIKEELEEAYGGASGPFPDRYGDAHEKRRLVPPRRGHPMYKTDDELREIGADIGNILELAEKAISNLSEMQARYGEMAHMGTYATSVQKAAQTLSDKYRGALDELSRSTEKGWYE
jgi:hypothetical protein